MAKVETAAKKRARMAAEKATAAIKDAAESEQESVNTKEIIEDGYPDNIHEAEVMAVRTRNGGTFWRGGQQFGKDWRVFNRSELANDRDWTRIAADPQLEVRGVTLQAIDESGQ